MSPEDKNKANKIFEAIEDILFRSVAEDKIFDFKRYLVHKMVWSCTCDNDAAEAAAKNMD